MGERPVERFVADMKRYWDQRPFIWFENQKRSGLVPSPPSRARVLILGPHPDDPESAAITIRLLMNSGCEIFFAIACMSPEGVDDEYASLRHDMDSLSLLDRKIEIRRREQKQSAQVIGIASKQLTFLDIEKSRNKNSLDTSENRLKIRNHLEFLLPDIVITPAGKDTNQTHVWVCKIMRQCIRDLSINSGKTIIALYNEDPKTMEIHPDLFVLFGEKSALWKKSLLKVHDSQQQRNISRQQKGFDERILRVNLESYEKLLQYTPLSTGKDRYAEVFEIEIFDHDTTTNRKGIR